ncbi:MAG: hypothetical protein OXD50_14045 [Chloroflexi bacterium]|nr:hypothetical protein [Chloroflexota bacterium]
MSMSQRIAALALTALLGALCFALSPAPAPAQTSEEFAFRIAVRLSETGERLEFGIQRLDAEGRPRLLHLADKRFFPLSIRHHRWLRGDTAQLLQAPYYDAPNLEASGWPAGLEGVDVKVVARLHPIRGQVEFGATWELDSSQLVDSAADAFVDPVFPKRRFFPRQVSHGRWLFSSPLRFTRVWSGDSMMETGATLEAEATEPEPEAEPTQTTESCLAFVERLVGTTVSGQCHALLTAYCEGHPEHAWCRSQRQES